jgi:stage II sporulation protein E
MKKRGLQKMKVEVQPYQRIRNKICNEEELISKTLLGTLLTKNNLILLAASFLLGRASLVAGLMPFGISIYAVTLGLEANRLLVAAFVILGMITGGAKEQIYITVAAMFLFNAFNIPFRRNVSNLNLRYAVVAFVAVLVPELLYAYLQGFLLFDILGALLNGFVVFVLVFIFKNAVGVISNIHKKSTYTKEEVISIAITVAIAISGVADVQMAGFNLKNVMCILIILVFSYKAGAGVGAAIGVTVGLIVSMSSSNTPLLIASYAFCGLLAGVLRGMGKIGAGLGFIMGNAILTLYINGSTEVLIYLKEIIISIALFMIIPQRFINKLVEKFEENSDAVIDKRGYSLRIKEITVEKLNKFSRAFKELSRTFSEISETRVVTEKQDISTLFDRVADKICKDCSLCLHCWDRNFYNTYQVMFKIIEKIDSKGRIDESDIPEYFMERCERIHDFVQAVNSIYEVFKMDMVWRNKVGESRGLVSQQLESLSGVISNLASEINMDVHFKDDLEDLILMELNRSGIRANEAIVYENKWGYYEISIFHKGCGGKRNCINTIEETVSKAIGRDMKKESNECCQKQKTGICNLRFIEKETYKVTTGISRIPKYKGIASGDSYTFMNTGDGKFILALSDGMGTGQKAAVQSRATISLLEQFMESGFDKDTAVKLINSVLVLKSGDDSFSTIDMSVIDLFNGEVEFVKIGAVSTFIKRMEAVETVKSVSLPAGILCNIEMEMSHKKVETGDFIIMMTDGIIDSFNKDIENEKTIHSFISEITSTNPQEIAEIILNEANNICNGVPVDDMLVLVAKVWKSL